MSTKGAHKTPINPPNCQNDAKMAINIPIIIPPIVKMMQNGTKMMCCGVGYPLATRGG